MNARNVSIVVLGVALLGAMNSESFAQGRRGGFGRGGVSTPLMLVSNEAVQKELALNEDQTKKVTTLSTEVRSEREKLIQEAAAGLGDVQSLSEEERRTKMSAAFAEMSKKLNDQFAPKLAEILEPKQNERLKQIALQAAGPQAYRDAEVVKGLGLSKEQQDKLAALADENQKKVTELFSGGGGSGGFEKARELRDELAAKSKEVLSKEQQDKFEELKGKPFDTSTLFGGGRGRRGDRRSGGEQKTEEKK